MAATFSLGILGNQMETNSSEFSCPKYVCDCCDYQTALKESFKKHLLTQKHLETKWKQNSSEKYEPIFSCNLCDYQTSLKSDYLKHLKVRKHLETNSSENSSESYSCLEDDAKLKCSCGLFYKNRSGLWKHKKKCKDENVVVTSDTMTNLVVSLVKQNQEFQKQIFDMMKDNIGTTNNHSNNTTTNNTKFNLNFFLNETCKDAMNLTDFVDSLKITLTDLENVGKLGYTEGISRIFTKGLKELEVHKRPIHCSDLKRETVYVKNENKWERENNHLKKAIKQITNKNIRLIPKWKEQNPGHHEYNNKKNDEYLKIMYESMGPADEVEESKSFGKIITNLAKETIIVKASDIM